MQILVLSDSHGDADAVRRAIDAHPQAKTVIHLGDGAREAAAAAASYRERAFHIVCGNCDIGTAAPACETVSLGGVRFYLTHGFAERVKSGLLTLLLTAKEREAAAALYGHTHIPLIDRQNGVLLFNPGSVGAARGATYGLLNVSNGAVEPHILPLP